jgi:hypothetical protein
MKIPNHYPLASEFCCINDPVIGIMGFQDRKNRVKAASETSSAWPEQGEQSGEGKGGSLYKRGGPSKG